MWFGLLLERVMEVGVDCVIYVVFIKCWFFKFKIEVKIIVNFGVEINIYEYMIVFFIFDMFFIGCIM